MQSWKSPGLGDSRGSPERPSIGSNPHQNIGQSGLPTEKESPVPRNQQYRPPSIQTELQTLHHDTSQRDGREDPIIQGGSHATHQSRLFGYMTSFSTGHQSLPQSYPASQPFIHSFSQSYSPPLQPIHSTSEIISPYRNIDEQSPASFGSSHPPRTPQMPPFAGPQGGPPQNEAQSWGTRLSPPSMPSTQAALYREAPHPQVPQTLLPSISALIVDTATHGSVSEQTRSPIPTLSSSPSPVSASLDDQKPLPQNLRGDPFRSAKVKTELCRFFNTPKGCVFGDKCNYAHGENELKFNKLLDLEAAGLVDVEIFRCHVCSTWVATGACPFDQRCTRLHDPRVIGRQPSWLPHAEVLGNNKKEQEVDKLYHQQYSSIYSCSPVYGFAPKNRWKADESSTNSAWKEFYSFCCNVDSDSDQPNSEGVRWQLSSPKKSKHVEINEMHWLAMALMMRERRKAQHYVYSPSHIVCGDLCLVLQTSYFVLEAGGFDDSAERYKIIEVSKEEAANIEKGKRVIVAREIAFGPVADASVRQVSIYFDIKPTDIARCTRQQARKHRRSRHRIGAKRHNENQTEDWKIISSCSIPPFACHQPMDEAAFNLITGILTHRYRVLKRNYFYSSSGLDQRSRLSLSLEEERLRKSFESQRRFWMTWTWPKKIGSSDVGDDTEVPEVDLPYNFVPFGDPGYRLDSLFFGTDQQHTNSDESLQVISKQAKLATGLVWISFVMNLQLLSYQGAVEMLKEDLMPTHDPILSKIRRIPTLRSLSLGQPAVLSSSWNVPILRPQLCSSTPAVISLDVMIREWNFLMQRQSDDNTSHPLKDAKQGNPRHPDSAERRPLSYSFEVAAHSWSREVPRN
mmetsp:Transcript_6478/g.11492  ORF Transcript_6478/g.11492 Transcript_6478/m.11492 type:complete len:853 (-) Transcript_6478:202-2760(-)